MRQLYHRIFGVPADRAQAVAVTPRAVEADYKPESELTSQQIQGAADGGTRWAFWRSDPDGQRWFKRVAADSPAPTIQAFAPLGDDEDEFNVGDDLDPIEKLRRETAILKSRYDRGEIQPDIFSSDDYSGDVDDDG